MCRGKCCYLLPLRGEMYLGPCRYAILRWIASLWLAALGWDCILDSRVGIARFFGFWMVGRVASLVDQERPAKHEG